MTHFYERNIVEIKKEYTKFLSNIITPLIYEGIKNIYTKSIETEKIFEEAAKENPDIKNPGVLRIFQTFLKGIKNINDHNIEAECNRIKEKSKCSGWLDDLIKSVVKSYIVLLTYNVSEKTCKLVNEKFHETIDTKSFIHKCYIECARSFFNYPELFWHGFSTIEIKRNQREAHNIIRGCIKEAVRKMLPMKLILEEYLKNDYIQESDDYSQDMPKEHYENMRSMVKKDLTSANSVNRILDSDDELEGEINEISKEAEKIENDGYDGMIDIDLLINKNIDNIKNQTDMTHIDKTETGKIDNNINKIDDTNKTDNINKPDNINKSDNINADKNSDKPNNNNNNNSNNSVFGKIDDKANIIDNTEKDLEFKLNQPGYVKEPSKIKGGSKFILNEQINAYKNTINKKLNDNKPKDNIVNNNKKDDDININVVKNSVKSDKSAFFDKIMANTNKQL